MKKEIKTLTSKLKFLHNPTKKNQKQVQQDSALQQQKKVPLPKGAKSTEEGVYLLDLQIIDLKKQNDLVHAKIIKKQQYCDALVEEHHKLVAYKNEKNSPTVLERPPETMEEDQNRKVGRKLIFLRSLQSLFNERPMVFDVVYFAQYFMLLFTNEHWAIYLSKA